MAVHNPIDYKQATNDASAIRRRLAKYLLPVIFSSVLFNIPKFFEGSYGYHCELVCFYGLINFFGVSTLSPKSHVKRWFFNLPPNSRGLKTARFWPQISSTPNVIFSSSELPSNSVNSEVSYSVNHFWKFHHFLYYNKGWSRPILNGLWAGPRG